MRALIRATLLLVMAGCALLATAAPALFTLDELVERSRHVFLAEVIEVSKPKWKDEQGNDVVLATATVTRVLKGDVGTRVIIAYKANVDDQPQMQRGDRYLVFSVGSGVPLLQGHQVRALPVQGQEVSTYLLKGEREKQSLSVVEDRIARMVKGT